MGSGARRSALACTRGDGPVPFTDAAAGAGAPDGSLAMDGGVVVGAGVLVVEAPVEGVVEASVVGA